MWRINQKDWYAKSWLHNRAETENGKHGKSHGRIKGANFRQILCNGPSLQRVDELVSYRSQKDHDGVKIIRNENENWIACQDFCFRIMSNCLN